MDLGSSRPPQPSDRRVVNSAQPAQPYRPPEEPVRIAPAPEPVQPRRTVSSAPAPSRKPIRKGWLIASILVALLVIAAAVWLLLGQGRANGAGIDAGKFQTVYLMNGQIYFGKLTAINDAQYKLSNVYYLQTAAEGGTNEQASTQTSAANNSQLIKLSNAVYGPDDEMVISKDQVLYFQNLNPEGRAAQLIKSSK